VFILPTPEAAQKLMGRFPEGPFIMLNLYRLREVAAKLLLASPDFQCFVVDMGGKIFEPPQ
jgi:hypothetical protein